MCAYRLFGGAAKLHSEWRDLPQRYEIWSSGGYTERALSLIAARQQQTPKYRIEARDAAYVHAEVCASKDDGLIRTYEEHFINHPMRELERSQERAKRKAVRDKKRNPPPALLAPPRMVQPTITQPSPGLE